MRYNDITVLVVSVMQVESVVCMLSPESVGRQVRNEMQRKRPDSRPKCLEASSDVHPQERQASSEQSDQGHTLTPNPAHVENSSHTSSETVATQSCQGRVTHRMKEACPAVHDN